MDMIAIYDVRNEECDFISKHFGDDVLLITDSLSLDTVPEDPDSVETLCVFVSSDVTSEVIDAFPNLSHITTRSTGTDHIDIDYAKQKGISISHVPGYGEQTVAEFAFALVLTLSRKIFDAYSQVRRSGDRSFTHLRGFDLYGKTFGVLGTGKIGAHAARIATGFGMKVVAYDAYPNHEIADEIGFEYLDSVEELARQSDILSLHVPYLPETHHIINADVLKNMKDTALLINTARGELVDTSALVQSLSDGSIAGAGLDVLEGERQLSEEAELLSHNTPDSDIQTLLENHVLIDMNNVVVTPHVAFYSQEAEEQILTTMLENITQYGETGTPAHLV